jgi:hypothetical protein
MAVADLAPSIRTVPASGLTTPQIIPSVVVFPAPFAPSHPVILPSVATNETPSTARTAPYLF